MELSIKSEVLSVLLNRVIYKDPERKELYLQAINNEHGKGTSNSKHTFEWDQRYNNIYEVAHKLDLLPLKVSRSHLWEVMFVINVKTKEIYAFMKAKTLKNVLKSDGQHYTKLLNQFNASYDHLPPISQQTTLFGVEENKDELLNLAKEMINSSAIIPEKFFIFAFEDNSLHTTIKALAFNTSNELIFTKNLSHLLTTDYSSILESDNITPKKFASSSQVKLPQEGTSKNGKKKSLLKLKTK
ncbi:DUF5986 family protein [Rummeliibacillus pycnus]|uniref:DUF5986 family protein n=1 Tax=Rummeliibacillus pycnus TaxID=101070 RepID=UPI000C9CEE60|nr:DUF5986 family protein [Rummeliibacillus pycnus]